MQWNDRKNKLRAILAINANPDNNYDQPEPEITTLLCPQVVDGNGWSTIHTQVCGSIAKMFQLLLVFPVVCMCVCVCVLNLLNANLVNALLNRQRSATKLMPRTPTAEPEPEQEE